MGGAGAGCAFGAETAGGEAACFGAVVAVGLLGFAVGGAAGAVGEGAAFDGGAGEDADGGAWAGSAGAAAGGVGCGAGGVGCGAEGVDCGAGTGGTVAVSSAGVVWQPDRASDAAIANTKIADRVIGVYLDTAGPNRQPTGKGCRICEVATIGSIAQTSRT